MKIKNIAIIGCAIILVIGLVVISIVYKLVESRKSTEAADEIKYRSYIAADELRQSSDDLTRLARLYVSVADTEPEQAAEYLREYNAILDIRNGKVNRPKNYNGVFWDLAAVSHKNPTEDSNEKNL